MNDGILVVYYLCFTQSTDDYFNLIIYQTEIPPTGWRH